MARSVSATVADIQYSMYKYELKKKKKRFDSEFNLEFFGLFLNLNYPGLGHESFLTNMTQYNTTMEGRKDAEQEFIQYFYIFNL